MGQAKKKSISFCLILTLCIAQLLSQTVRIGIFPLGNYSSFDSNGNPAGYAVAYFDHINQYCDWSIQYVNTGTFQGSLDALESGEVDIICPFPSTKDGHIQFLYPSLSSGTSYLAIYTTLEFDQILYEDFAAISKLRIGLVANSADEDAYRAYATSHNISSPITKYSNARALEAALKGHEVDAIVASTLTSGEDLHTLGTFAPTPLYHIVQAGNTKLWQELDAAINEATMEDPAFSAFLQEKFFPLYNKSQYTFKEKQFITSLPVLNIGYPTNLGPIGYSNNGKAEGIIRDILDRIATSAGFRFNYIPLPDGKFSEEYLKEQKIYILATDTCLQEDALQDGVYFSHFFLSSENVFIARKGVDYHNNDRITLAVLGRNGLDASAYPTFVKKTFATVSDAFAALESGEAQLLLLNRYELDLLLSTPLGSSYTIIPIQDRNGGFCLKIMDYPAAESTIEQRSKSKHFLNIINKAIDNISKTEKLNIILAHTTAKQDLAQELIQKGTTTPPLLGISLLTSSCLIIYAVYLMINNKRIIKEKDAELLKVSNLKKQTKESGNQFVSNIHQEITPPLDAIIELTREAKSDTVDAETMHKLIERIETSATDLKKAVDDMLDVKASHENNLTIKHAAFSLGTLVEKLRDESIKECQEKRITFTLNKTEGLPEALIGDVVRTKQALSALLSNAVRCTPHGGSINFTISQTGGNKDRAYLRFTIVDTICGIKAELLSKHTTHQRIESAQKDKDQVQNLSIAKHLITLMGGLTDEYRTPEKGTTFTIDLPFFIAKETKKNAGQTDLSALRILIVNDGNLKDDALLRILAPLGVDYTTIEKEEDALRTLSKADCKGLPYQVCIIALATEEGPDTTFIKTIRKMFSREETTIIALIPATGDAKDRKDTTVADYCLKEPVSEEALLQVLRGIKDKKEKRKDPRQDNRCPLHKVLLAEDVALNREIAQKLLSLIHVATDTAMNGKEALEKFTASPPGTYIAIFLDVQMPIMDGYDTARAIRASGHPDAKSIGIYAMSANSSAKAELAALNAGMNGHIPKPINPAILKETLLKEEARWDAQNKTKGGTI